MWIPVSPQGRILSSRSWFMNMKDCVMHEHLASSGKVNPAASRVMLPLSLWPLRGQEPQCGARSEPMFSTSNSCLRLKDLLFWQDSPPRASISPFPGCPWHYIIPMRSQYWSLSYLHVYFGVPRLLGVLYAVPLCNFFGEFLSQPKSLSSSRSILTS